MHHRQRGVHVKSNREGVPTASGSVRRVWSYEGTSNPRLSLQPIHESGWPYGALVVSITKHDLT